MDSRNRKDWLAARLSRIEADGPRPFLVDSFGNRTYSYSEAHRLASLLAIQLQERGVGKGGRVGLLLHNSVEFALLYFACLYLGAVAVPINPVLSPREVEFITGHAGLRLLVYSPSTQPLLGDPTEADYGFPLWRIVPGNEKSDHGALLLEGLPATVPGDFTAGAGVTDEDLFSLTFTSGTTGQPKGVAHRVGALLHNAAAYCESLGLGAESRFLHVMPMAYMAGFLNTLLCPFMAGGSVVITSAFSPLGLLRFWQPVIEHRPDTFWMSPTMLASLLALDRDPRGAEYCRERAPKICVGTAPLMLSTRREFEARYGVELLESYGLSELLIITINAPGQPLRDGSVGRPLSETEIRFTGEGGSEVPPGTDGEIQVRSAYMTEGYLDYETLEPARRRDGEWFPTGDIGHLDAGGELFITGRKKDLIIRGGINVSPRMVEDVLLQHDSVAQVAVVGLPHPLLGEEVVAVVQLSPGHHLEEHRAALISLCKAQLSPAAVPTTLVATDSIPTSANGKIQKNRIREQLLAERETRRSG